MNIKKLKNIVKLENRDYDELNTMANRIIDEDLKTLFGKHANGNKREQINAYSALAKKFPEYKMFCYPETFLKENELLICQENCDFVRRSAFYDMVANYQEVSDFVDLIPSDIRTDLTFVEWSGRKKQPDKEAIDKIRETYIPFVAYAERIREDLEDMFGGYEDENKLEDEQTNQEDEIIETTDGETDNN